MYAGVKSFFAVVFIVLLLSAFDKKPALTPYPFPELLFFPEMPVNPDNPVTVEGAELGRYLFYDSILSLDYSLSCASCHKQQFAFSDGGTRYSKGFKGERMVRNTPPLFNLAWYSAFFWDGRAATLEEQVFQPVRAHNEMHLNWNEAARRIRNHKLYKRLFKNVFGTVRIDSTHIARAIAQFERTLISNGSRYDRVLAGREHFTKEETEGFVIANEMVRGDCLHCHTTDGNALGTTGLFSNNGLDTATRYTSYPDAGKGGVTHDPTENGWFKIPSLRNLLFTHPYMHDGRFRTLEEVVAFYSSGVHPSVNLDAKMEFARQGGVKLSEEDQRKLVAFLKTLSDSVFITNPAFSNPFKK